MAYYDTPMTKLEAVNICLSSIGEPSVNDLDTAGVDAQLASDIVDETARSMLLRGWYWNEEVHTLSPDVSGNLTLPANTAKVDTLSIADLDIVQRGLRLYNKGDNTYTFTAPLEVKLTVLLPFDELPLAARDYIAARAAMTFQQRILGADKLDSDLTTRAKEAWVEIIRDDNEVADPNMLEDNWSTAAIVRSRGWFRRGAWQ